MSYMPQSGTDARYVELAGDTMSGDLTITKATPRMVLNGSNPMVSFQAADRLLAFSNGELAALNSAADTFQVLRVGTPVGNADATPKGYVDSGSTTTVTPTAPWVDFGSSYAGLYATKTGPIVVLEGLIKPTSTQSLSAGVGYSVANVPVGFRPSHNVYFPGAIAGATWVGAMLMVNTVGVMQIVPFATVSVATNGYIPIASAYRQGA